MKYLFAAAAVLLAACSPASEVPEPGGGERPVFADEQTMVESAPVNENGVIGKTIVCTTKAYEAGENLDSVAMAQCSAICFNSGLTFSKALECTMNSAEMYKLLVVSEHPRNGP